jgi:hypothetical protein
MKLTDDELIKLGAAQQIVKERLFNEPEQKAFDYICAVITKLRNEEGQLS